MLSQHDVTKEIVRAIWFRNQVDSGMQSQEWIRQEVRTMIESGFWNDPQIAELSRYTRQSIGKIARDCRRPAQRAAGGRLTRGSLDVVLELRSATLKGEKPNALLLQECVKTRTSTKLIARLTGITLGTVLYQQRRLKHGTTTTSGDRGH